MRLAGSQQRRGVRTSEFGESKTWLGQSFWQRAGDWGGSMIVHLTNHAWSGIEQLGQTRFGLWPHVKPCLALPSRHGQARPRLPRRYLAKPDLAMPGLARPGHGFPGLAWPGLTRPSLAWPGKAHPAVGAKTKQEQRMCKKKKKAFAPAGLNQNTEDEQLTERGGGAQIG
jgi:hypothetical protein